MSEKHDSIYTGKISPRLDRGRDVEVRGYKFHVPELMLGEREELEDVFEQIERASKLSKRLQEAMRFKTNLTEEQVDKLRADFKQADRASTQGMINVVLTALQRNYPDIDAAFIKRHFSASALGLAYTAAVVPNFQGSENSAGEAEAAATAALNGTASMAS